MGKTSAAAGAGIGAGALVRAEEVRAAEHPEFVLLDGHPQGAPEVVLRKAREGGLEAARIGRFSRSAIAEYGTLLSLQEGLAPVAFVELERRAVNAVGSGLGQVIDHRSHVAPVLGAELIGDDLHARDRVLVAEEDLGPGDGVVVVGLAIDFEVVGAAALAVGGECGAVVVGEIVVVGLDDAGFEQGDGIKSVVEGKVGELQGIEGGGNLRLGGLNQRIGGSHFHGGRGAGRLHDQRAQIAAAH